MTSRNASNISVVLTETRHEGNIGSAVRAMRNMGLNRLKLVSPRLEREEEIERLAVGAVDLYRSAGHFDSLEDALAEEQVVVGTTSSRGRKSRVRVFSARELAPRILGWASEKRVALVFGPERTGLSEGQLARCQYLVRIESSDEFPTLNLAHSVLVLAYELFLAQAQAERPDETVSLARQSELERMYSHMERVLIEIGFLSRSNPEHIMRSIRRFLSRAELTPRDVRILRGIMSQMDWYVREGRQRDPERVKKS